MKQFIDKLIGRLEEEKAKHDEQRAIKTDETECISAITALQAMADRYRDAIEIVNQLAEEYNNDVCEWEKGSSGYVGYPAYYSRCCTTNSKGLEMQTHIISDWKFCPYCGKKIKMVE